MNRLVNEWGSLGAIVGILGVVDSRQWRTCADLTAVVLYESASTTMAV